MKSWAGNRTASVMGWLKIDVGGLDLLPSASKIKEEAPFAK